LASLQSRKVYSKAFEIIEGAMRKRALVRGSQDHARRVASLKGFLPAGGTEAPTVTRIQARKARSGNRCRKIVAMRFGELEKRRSHNGANRVTANVLSTGITTSISVKPCHRFVRTEIKRLTEDVSRAAPPTSFIAGIVPQHCCLS
jgi:hypothetical protein